MNRAVLALVAALPAACSFGDPLPPLTISGLRAPLPDGGVAPLVSHLDVCQRPLGDPLDKFTVVGTGFEPRVVDQESTANLAPPEVVLVGPGGGTVPVESTRFLDEGQFEVLLTQTTSVPALGVSAGTFALAIQRRDGASASLESALTVKEASACAH